MLCSQPHTVEYIPRRKGRLNLSQKPLCFRTWAEALLVEATMLTFLPAGEEASGGGVLVMFSGLEPQLEGDDPLTLLEKS